MRKVILILILSAGIAGCGGKGSSSPAAPSPAPSSGGTAASAAISIQGDGYGAGVFTPSQIEVNRGTAVSWSNADQLQHTVTSNTGLFDSGAISGGGGFGMTFTSAGTYPYHCTIHTNMTGTIVVK